MGNIDSLAGRIMSYEDGTMGPDEEIELFADLVSSGMAWTLQGHYGRTAMAMIEAGLISEGGEVL